jgi:CheY-like chemotaxis protein
MPVIPPILLVEDNEDDARLFLDVLARSGLPNTIRQVDNGMEAVAYLSGQSPYDDRELFPVPGIVLLDLSLPKMNGWDVLKFVRSRRELDSLLVVVLTASQRLEEMRRAYALGANSFLIKPCRPEDLKNLAHAFCDRWFAAIAATPQI